MEHLEIYHLLKWNHHNYLIVQQTCVKMAMVLHYMFLKFHLHHMILRVFLFHLIPFQLGNWND